MLPLLIPFSAKEILLQIEGREKKEKKSLKLSQGPEVAGFQKQQASNQSTLSQNALLELRSTSGQHEHAAIEKNYKKLSCWLTAWQ